MQNKIKIIIFVLLIFTYIITNLKFNNVTNEPVKINIKDKIPYIINDYQGIDQEIPEKLYKIISPEEIILRTYKKGDKEINLAVVISDNKEDIHAPEVCYKLQGFDFQKEETVSIFNGCEISKVLTIKNDKPYIFYFWYTDMENVYKNRIEFMINLIINKLLNKTEKKYALVISFTETSNNEDIKVYVEKINQYILQKF